MTNLRSFRVMGAVGVMAAMVSVAEARADAKVIRVPADAATIQAAVLTASDGDVIRVAPGRHCGAVIDREVALVGAPGATIVGCAGIYQSGTLRVGFLLVDDRASGTSIRGFRFDGAGVSDTNLAPLAFAVFGRGAHGVAVLGNTIDGTVQGITNTGGDGWWIAGNAIRNLTLFGCGVGRCGGGIGIVLQQRDVALDRGFGSTVLFNDVSGAIPDGQALFGMAAVFVLGQELPVIAFNRLSLPENPKAPATGIGVNVSDVCCGQPTGLLTTHHAIIVGNDGRGSQIAVQVDRDASGGTGNSVGAIIRDNRGVVSVDGVSGSNSARLIGASVAALQPLD